MGMSLDVSVGYGVKIPYDAVSERLELDALRPFNLEDIDEDDDPYGDDEYFDPDEALETFLSDEYPLLSFAIGRSGEYITGGAVYVSRLSADGYYSHAWLEVPVEPTAEETHELAEASKELGIEFKPGIIAIPSYW